MRKWELKVRCSATVGRTKCVWDGRPCDLCVKLEEAANSMLAAQRALRNLFGEDKK